MGRRRFDEKTQKTAAAVGDDRLFLLDSEDTATVIVDGSPVQVPKVKTKKVSEFSFGGGGSQVMFAREILVEPSADVVVGKVYKTYAAAKDYIEALTAGAEPSPFNPMCIQLPSGSFTEQVTFIRYVTIKGRNTLLTQPLKSLVLRANAGYYLFNEPARIEGCILLAFDFSNSTPSTFPIFPIYSCSLYHNGSVPVNGKGILVLVNTQVIMGRFLNTGTNTTLITALGGTIKSCDMTDPDLKGVMLSECVLEGGTFKDCDMNACEFEGGTFKDCDMNACEFGGGSKDYDLDGSTLNECTFQFDLSASGERINAVIKGGSVKDTDFFLGASAEPIVQDVVEFIGVHFSGECTLMGYDDLTGEIKMSNCTGVDDAWDIIEPLLLGKYSNKGNQFFKCRYDTEEFFLGDSNSELLKKAVSLGQVIQIKPDANFDIEGAVYRTYASALAYIDFIGDASPFLVVLPSGDFDENIVQRKNVCIAGNNTGLTGILSSSIMYYPGLSEIANNKTYISGCTINGIDVSNSKSVDDEWVIDTEYSEGDEVFRLIESHGEYHKFYHRSLVDNNTGNQPSPGETDAYWVSIDSEVGVPVLYTRGCIFDVSKMTPGDPVPGIIVAVDCEFLSGDFSGLVMVNAIRSMIIEGYYPPMLGNQHMFIADGCQIKGGVLRGGSFKNCTMVSETESGLVANPGIYDIDNCSIPEYAEPKVLSAGYDAVPGDRQSFEVNLRGVSTDEVDGVALMIDYDFFGLTIQKELVMPAFTSWRFSIEALMFDGGGGVFGQTITGICRSTTSSISVLEDITYADPHRSDSGLQAEVIVECSETEGVLRIKGRTEVPGACSWVANVKIVQITMTD